MSKRVRRHQLRRQSSVPSPESDFPALEGADHRQVRLEHVLFDELQSIIRDEASDPALSGVTLLAVQLSQDAGHARIPYAVEAPLRDEQLHAAQTGAALSRANAFLRARLAQQLDLKRTPKLTFVFVGLTGGAACPE